MRQEFPELSMQQLTEKIGERWSSMSENDKKSYSAFPVHTTPTGEPHTSNRKDSIKDRIGPKKTFSGAARSQEFTMPQIGATWSSLTDAGKILNANMVEARYSREMQDVEEEQT